MNEILIDSFTFFRFQTMFGMGCVYVNDHQSPLTLESVQGMPPALAAPALQAFYDAQDEGRGRFRKFTK